MLISIIFLSSPFLTFISFSSWSADRELYDVVYKKDAELHANVDILARKEAAQVERIIAQGISLFPLPHSPPYFHNR